MATLQNSDGSYAFDTVANDPLKVQIFTLSNGLKVYMSVNKEAPRIQTLIATKAGSKNDPSDATGLAHYLEHMLFKGTSKIASLDWDSEKKLLQQISDLYEQHRAADSTERTAIYQQIDSLSGLAAQHTVSNEYDQLLSGLGAQNTNAFTFLDRTVYMNDIPSNELEKWLKLESERFSELVLRLFHTELETVYEEYNMTQTNDYRKVFQAMLQGLLPNHPYGTQSTIGTGEHLKAPSMEKIHEFFDSYYVPNNMAIILSGDFDPNEMAELVEQYWGKFKTKRLPKKSKSKPHSNAGTVTKEVLGKEKAAVQIGFKLEGGNADASLLAQLCVALLYNQKAGLMDVNLIQKQILGAQSSADFLAAKDYSFIFLYGEPRAGMSLDQVKDYLLKEISRLAMGHFEDWLIEAVINNLEITAIQNFQSNSGRAFSMLDAFIFDKEWSTVCTKFESMRRFSKADITAFAQNCLNKDKAVIVYKQEGEDLGVETVEKPLITPVEINRTASSDYAKVFNKLESPSLKPVFVDYDKALKQDQLDKQIPFDYLHNENNQTFDFVYDAALEYYSLDFTPSFDTDYKLKVVYANETYESSEEQLMHAVPIDNLEQGDGTLFSGDEKEVIISYTDSAERNDFYLFDFGYQLYLATKDEFYQGNLFTFSYFYDDLLAGDEAVIKIMGIDERHFNFMTILIDQTEDGGNPFSTTPSTVRGNLSNMTNPDHFPMGYFRLSETYSASLILE